jgi:hypothetical protein
MEAVVMRGRFFCALLGVVFLFVGSAWAAVPQQLHYQGYLEDGAGEAVDCPDPVQCAMQYNLTFRLYPQDVGGVVLWDETHSAVSIYKGSIHVKLGQGTPITGDLLEGTTWLGVTVNNNVEMSPRQELVSGAYALRANVAEHSESANNALKLGGIDATEFVPGPKFSGSFVDLTDVPDDLGDGDDNTQLSEVEVDAMVANNGFLTLETLPAGVADGDDDTQMSEPEVDAMVANNGFLTLETLPTGVADGDNDTLGSLSCAENEVARWDGSSWVCAGAMQGVSIGSPPASCDATTAGQMYLDPVANALMICDGVAYQKAQLCSTLCADLATVFCGLATSDGCGASCEGTGTALNPGQCDAAATLCGSVVEDSCGNSCGINGVGFNVAQCDDPSSVECGAVIVDSCVNSCSTTGSGLNTGQCDPTTTACAQAVVDGCGNDCGLVGQFCAGGVACEAAGCASPACDPATEVDYGGRCYYLDGSQGACDPGYVLAPQSVLYTIGPDFAGKTYKHTVSGNCCIYNAEADEDFGMADSCNEAGPFTATDVSPGGAGCTNQLNFDTNQLTLCMSAD